jgi:hypothetical protein
MKSTSMATNSPTLGVESKGSFMVIQKNMCEPMHIQKIICHRLRMECSFMNDLENRIGWNICTKPIWQPPFSQIVIPKIYFSKSHL